MKEKILAGLTIPVTLGLASIALFWSPAAALDPGVAVMTASNGLFNIDTFSVNGTIASLVYTQSVPYILTGNWSLDVSSANVTAFHANINALKSDGSDSQSFRLANFVAGPNSIMTNRTDGSKVISGYIDIANSNQLFHRIPVTLTIAKFRAMSIVLGDALPGILVASQPIYGTVEQQNSLTRTSAVSSPLLPEGNGAAITNNATPPIGLPQLPNPFLR